VERPKGERRVVIYCMNRKLKAALLLTLAGSLALLVTGCSTVEQYSLTYRLWDTGDLRKFSEPAPNPNLALFETTNGVDVLVEYDALSEKHSCIKRQAYHLHESEALIVGGKQPKLVRSAVRDGMKPIPVLPTPLADTTRLPELPRYGVPSREGRGFTLYRAMKQEESSDLPVYPETSGTPIRIVLTPFAVAGDTVMVGVAAAVVGCLIWLQGGAPGL